MATPSHYLGLDVLDGVHFQSGPDLIYHVTGTSAVSVAGDTIDVSAMVSPTGHYNFGAINTLGFDVDPSGFPISPTNYGVSYVNYSLGNGTNLFPQFATLNISVPGLGGYHPIIVGFADNALLVTVSSPSPGGIAAGQFYVINLTYSANSLVQPAPLTAPLHFTGDPAAAGFSPACFAAGTRVLTRRGEVAVEDLVEGDEAATVSGEFRPVIWIGSRQVKPGAYPQPDEVHPVRVRAGAFGEGAPARDLRLSPGHAVWVDGVLVPVGLLVNGATIVQEQVDQVRYFHVELDAHDVLLAEGLPCESYLDDGNREVFANSPEHVDLYGRLDTVDWEGACAPVLRGREEDLEALAAIKARLHARALDLGWRVETGAVSLLADGVMIEPMHVVGERLWFQVPAAGEVALASIAGRPCELVPGALDRRRLGVAVSEVRVDGRPLALDGEAFGGGFLEVEQQDLGRLAVQGPALMEVTLRAAATAWTRPAPALRLVQAG